MTQKDKLGNVVAEEEVRTATGRAISGGSISVYFYKGEYKDKQDCDCAITNCSKLIEQDPNNVMSYINRGAAYELNGDYELAIADYTKVIELDTKCSIAYNNLGSAYYGMKNYIMAQEYWSKALRLAPNNTVVKKNLELLGATT
jgi:tetratricopeptide (TPR) repeat protein